MRWILNKVVLLFCVLASCTSKKEGRPFSVTRAEAFLVKDVHQEIPKDTVQYLMLEPDLCVSCVGNLIRQVVAKATGHPLKIIAIPAQADYLRQHLDNGAALIFITSYDRSKLSRQVFLQSGLALARSWNHQVQQLEPVR